MFIHVWLWFLFYFWFSGLLNVLDTGRCLFILQSVQQWDLSRYIRHTSPLDSVNWMDVVSDCGLIQLWFLEQVISVKAVAIALKLSFGGSNQFIYIQTWFFIVVVIVCCLVQLNYLNKVSVHNVDAICVNLHLCVSLLKWVIMFGHAWGGLFCNKLLNLLCFQFHFSLCQKV